MQMTVKDMIKKKILDSQEMVRDYEMFSKHTADSEVGDIFKKFAEESGYQARKLQDILSNMRKNSR